VSAPAYRASLPATIRSYDELEARLARFKGTAAACVFGSGYLANTGIVPALVGDDDLIAIDELAHACLYAGVQRSTWRRPLTATCCA
jgi:8-amino-7-oxononanoate synthase